MKTIQKAINFFDPPCEGGSSIFFSFLLRAMLLIGVITGWSGKEEILTVLIADLIVFLGIRSMIVKRANWKR